MNINNQGKVAISKGVTFDSSQKKRRTGSVEDGLQLEIVPARVLGGHGKQGSNASSGMSKQALMPSVSASFGGQLAPKASASSHKPSDVLIHGCFLTYPDLSCFLMASQLVVLHWLARETTNTEPLRL